MINLVRQTTPKVLQKTFYSDFTINFDLNPITGSLVVLKNADSVKASIRNIILTGLGERFYQPHVGSAVRTSLFDLIEEMTAESIKNSIDLAIRNYEPRAQNVSVEVVAVPDNNNYEVTIYFHLINIPKQQFSTSIILNRIR